MLENKNNLHQEWIIVTRKNGTTYRRRQYKKNSDLNNKEDFEKRLEEFENRSGTDWVRLRNDLFFSHKFQGMFFDNRGKRILVPEQYKDVIEHKYGSQGLSREKFEHSLPGESIRLPGRDRSKEIKISKDLQKEDFDKVLPLIQENEKYLKPLIEKKNKIIDKLNTLEVKINAVKNTLSKLNEEKEKNLYKILGHLEMIRFQFSKDVDPTIKFDYNNQSQSISLNEMIDRLNKNSKKINPYKDMGLNNFEIEGVDDFEIDDFPKLKYSFDHKKMYEKVEQLKKKNNNLTKSMDPSHGGKLVEKRIIDSKGRRQTKWVSKEKPISTEKEKSWIDEFKKYKLNAYPIGVDKSEVRINTEGDVDSHWVMQWKDPKTGANKQAYTSEFLRRNAEYKWQRIQNINENQINQIKKGSIKNFLDNENISKKEASAIIYIISETGLRRGDKNLFKKSGNRGVSTLSPENVNIKGDVISFKFIGKSYQENTAKIKNKKIAEYLNKIKEERKEEEFLFKTNDENIDKVFDEVGGKGLKLKDLRTYVATDLARKILFEDKSDPPPLDINLTKTKKIKLIKNKLNKCYELVSQKLNNTPTMAKNAYIHPNIITKWIESLNVGDLEFKKGIHEENIKYPTLEEIKSQFPIDKNEINISSEDEEVCDFFNDVF